MKFGVDMFLIILYLLHIIPAGSLPSLTLQQKVIIGASVNNYLYNNHLTLHLHVFLKEFYKNTKLSFGQNLRTN